MVSTRRKESAKPREYKVGNKNESSSNGGAGTALPTKGARNRSAISSLWGKGNVTPESSTDAASEDANSSGQQPAPAEKATKKVGRKQKTVKIVVPVKPVVKRKGGRTKGKGGYRGGRKPAAQTATKATAKKAVLETAVVAPTTVAPSATSNVAKKASPRAGARAGTRSSHGINGASELFTGIDDINRFPPSVAAQKKKLLMQNKKKEQRQLRYMAVGDETTTVNKFGETVVKVKLLTGTLYIYKGNPEGTAKRRAEFVRSK